MKRNAVIALMLTAMLVFTAPALADTSVGDLFAGTVAGEQRRPAARTSPT